MAGKRTFVCFAAEDAFRAVPILAALAAWEVGHTALDAAAVVGNDLSAQTARAIAECEVFLRLCTGAIAASAPATAATDAFRQLLEEDRRRKRRTRRALINLILDPAYVNDPRDASRLYIATANKERALWLEELAIPLGVGTLAQRVSRRAVLGMGAGAALAVVASAGAGALLVRQQQAQAFANQPVPLGRLSGQPKFTYVLGQPTQDTLAIPWVASDGRQIYGRTADGIFTLSPRDGSVRPFPAALEQLQLDTISVFTAAQGLVFAQSVFRDAAPHHKSGLSVLRGSDAHPLWQVQLSDLGMPLAAGDLIYCQTYSDDTGAFVSAYRTRDGSVAWQQPLKADLFPLGYTALATGAGRVYAGSSDHQVHAFDARTGAPAWQYATSGDIHGVAFDGGSVFASCEDGSLYALDAGSGRLRWQFATRASIMAAAAVRDGVVYVGSRDGHLYALSGQTGALYWAAYAGTDEQSDLSHDIVNVPVFYGSIVFASYRTSLFAFDIVTGQRRWAFEPVEQVPSISVSNQPVVVGNLVLLGDSNNQVYALNP